jgi:hypothetical protein
VWITDERAYELHSCPSSVDNQGQHMHLLGGLRQACRERVGHNAYWPVRTTTISQILNGFVDRTYDELVANGGEFTALAAAGGDDTAASVGKDAEQEEVTKKELKKKLHKVLDTLRESRFNLTQVTRRIVLVPHSESRSVIFTGSEGGDVEKTEMEKMAKQLLGMVATVDREREHLRQTAEAYAKLAGENVDLLGKDGESGTRLTLRTTAKMVMKLGAASKLTAGTSKAEDDEIEKQLSRQITKETDQAGVLSA